MREKNNSTFLQGPGPFFAVAALVAALVLAAHFLPQQGAPAEPVPPAVAPLVPPAAPDKGTAVASPVAGILPVGAVGAPGISESATATATATAATAPTTVVSTSSFSHSRSESRWFPIPQFSVFSVLPSAVFPGLAPTLYFDGDPAPPLVLEWGTPSVTFAEPSASPGWDWSVSSDAVLWRDLEMSTRTTLRPVVLSFQRAFQIKDWEAFRPVLSVGAGVLRQTVEGGGAVPQSEMLPVFRAGFGAEWEPIDQVYFRLRYEYTRLPSESVLNPALPVRDHAIQTGVEIKF
jgi:hypothetical protein